VGILRKDFPEKDPYGTIVTVKKNDHLTTMIVEQDIRNNQTRMLKDKTDAFYLPYNTGFYAIDIDLLYKNDLPDYATPPKEILPDLPRSPKIGYAATDLLTLAKNPLTLTIDQDMFAVIKNADDIAKIGTVAKRFGLDILCKESALRN
jgi:hypothetical protein